jgi:vanillate O-demethylase ferredoxin subunit
VEVVLMGFSFAPSAREVLEQVVREPRFRELTRIPLIAPLEIGLMLGAYGLFGLGCYLYLRGAIGMPVALLINTFAIYASFTPLHDATHRTVSSHRGLNDLVGTLSCLLLLPGVTTGIYRYLHLEHHRYTGDPARDPDEPFVSAPALRTPLVLAGLDVLWTLWYLRHWNTRPLRERIEFVLSIAFYVSFHIFWLLSPWALEFVLLWMIPQRLGLFTVSYFFARIQHPHGVMWESAPFQATVRIEARPWTRWLLLGQAKHCIHHLAPSVPFYRYHKAWEIGRRLFEAQHIPVRTVWAPPTELRIAEVSSEKPRRPVRVARVMAVADGIKAYELVPTDDTPLLPFEAGAHIDVEITPKLVRQYSLCNAPCDTASYLIAVRHDPVGRGGSDHLHRPVKPGDVLSISAPRNNFPLAPGFDDHLLIAGGIGITPLLAMAHQLDARQARFKLHVCARNAAGIPFGDQLRDLAFAQSIVSWVDDARPDARFDAAAVIGAYRPGRALYVCGPAGFMQLVKQCGRAAGWPEDAMFSETFVPPAIDAAQNTRFEVQLVRSGQVLTVEPDQFLIDVLHANGCAVMCSCTQGICGSCMTPVLSGTPDHRDAILSDAEREANDRMTVCVSRARSSRLVLDL